MSPSNYREGKGEERKGRGREGTHTTAKIVRQSYLGLTCMCVVCVLL